ncbi:RuBisCO large subunit C-terminal-like domain-containing protein [Thiorhodovibrio frisius]|uniref:Ribulose 1,5-bisphosphate carboxylase, large subunit n=1 Tax=Thiorhodovibrio frisius TaxID=631362 RepID=H8Z1I0_9GAMM|nr:RuBisCO large subunit C-terminal-like domain-containing protein [Thiorhodovibrio frisius]EIC22529.1 ribulose 1,5-bisphosphate carboxylase, large subunit [Thiorhodovibrio frisius]WPL19968.1 Ribulose bisphosphate carboxylase-like protein 2 [Thiorhodovibrio frisius]
MKASDARAFFASPESLALDDYLLLDYVFECQDDPELAAAHLCSEQSTAQWKRVDVSEDYRPRFAAKVLDLNIEPVPTGFSVPMPEFGDQQVHRCRIRIAHPHANFGPRLPNLLSAVLGEGAFFAPGIPLIKLLDIAFPDAFLSAFQGPRFGIGGIREQLKVFDRPIFFGVIKPNIGLPPEPFAELAYEAWRGGLDIAKDDEMLADPDWSPLAERARLLGAARRRAEQETGVPKIYLANITDEVDRLLELHDTAVAAGAGAVMLNAWPTGLSAARMLRQHTKVPLVAHFPVIAAMSRLPFYGVHSRVLTKLQRLAGFDVIIMPGFGNRMMTPAEEVRACIHACVDPAFGQLKPSLPVPGGSDSAATLESVHAQVGSADFGFVPGRGVFSHPQGPAAGATSLHQAWQAISAGVPVAEAAEQQSELKAALATFG